MERVERPEPLTRVERMRQRFWAAVRRTTSRLFVATVVRRPRSVLSDAVLALHEFVSGRESRLSLELSVCAACLRKGPCAGWCIHIHQWEERL